MALLSRWTQMAVLATFLTLCQSQKFIQSPDFNSDWLPLHSQSSSPVLEVEHTLGEIPLQVKVLIRSRDFPDGVIFEGLGSGLADDDNARIYCGLVYFYNETFVTLLAPNWSNDADPGEGRIYCSGTTTYETYSGESYSTNYGEIKIIAWKETSFPAPDVELDGGTITSDSTNEALSYKELTNPLAEELDLIIVQYSFDVFGNTMYGNAVDGSNLRNTDVTGAAVAGLIFGYNEEFFRFWVPKAADAILFMDDGWGNNDIEEVNSVTLKIFGWKSLTPDITKSIVYNAGDDLPPNIPVSPKVFDAESSFISVGITARDGPNAGFTFRARGSIQAPQNSKTYGGMVYGVKKNSVYLYFPTRYNGYAINIGSIYGNGQHSQQTNNVNITVKIWNYEAFRRSACNFVIDPVVNSTTHRPLFARHCMRNCMESRTCVGFKRQGTTECQLEQSYGQYTLEGTLQSPTFSSSECWG